MSDFYDHNGLPISLEEWAVMYEHFDRTIGLDVVEVDEYAVTISTVWLGSDHNFANVGPPLIFETMIVGLPGDVEPMWRYSTLDEAVEGHRRAVNCLRDPLGRFTILP